MIGRPSSASQARRRGRTRTVLAPPQLSATVCRQAIVSACDTTISGVLEQQGLQAVQQVEQMLREFGLGRRSRREAA